MKDLLDKISSYNLFNYLLPGILFVCFANFFSGYNFVQDNNVISAFLCYFLGMVISRFGSLVLEPILKSISFLTFADYKSFVSASKKDEKIELFSEINNTYRTITAMFILLLLLKAYHHFEVLWNVPTKLSAFIAIVLLLLIFLLSYRKQTSYIRRRIDVIKNN
jgi:hypothetical protein